MGVTNDELSIFWIDCCRELARVDDHLALLDDAERRRAQRFFVTDHRQRYIICHGRLREILAAQISDDGSKSSSPLSPKGRGDLPSPPTPAELRLLKTATGKPFLDPAQNRFDLCFSLSHSGDWGVVAITRGREIGVDLQQVRAGIEPLEIAQRFFTRNEAEAIRLLPGTEQRHQAFLALWARKEAYLKACGMALSRMSRFEISVGLAEPPRLIQDLDDSAAGSRYQLHDLVAPDGYRAAIAWDCILLRRDGVNPRPYAVTDSL